MVHMVRKTTEEVAEEFREAVSRLEHQARDYEQGHHASALDMANLLRLLLHDKGRQVSLLTQVGLKGMKFFGTPNAVAGVAPFQFPLVRPAGEFWIERQKVTGSANYEPVYW